MKKVKKVLTAIRNCKYIFNHPLKNESDDYEPFFIIGSGRSGNTLLRRILNSNKEIHIPPETYMLREIIFSFKQGYALNWRNQVYLALAYFSFHREFETFEMDLKPLVKTLLDVPEEKRSLAFLLNSFYLYHASINNKKPIKWGDKTPINTFCLNEIYSVFPKAQFIHIIRDGCDVIPSYVRAGIYEDNSSAAIRWRDSINAAEKFIERYPDICFQIKYEDLVMEPESVSKQVCDFLGIEHNAAMLEIDKEAWEKMGDVSMRKHHENVLQPISSSSIGKGRKSLDENDRQSIRNIINSKLIQYGYEPC